jgi:hypothetical protein
MATAEVVPAAPAAAPSSAPSPSPASSPAPSSAPVSSPAPAQTSSSSVPASKVDPAKYPVREDYAKALFEEKMAELEQPAETAEPATQDVEVKVEDPAAQPASELAQETAKAQEEIKQEAQKPAEEEELFQLEPEAIVTPESLAGMVKDNVEFAKILEADPKLKGQLYKTAREAAELKPYREIFADIESAKTAQQATATWNEVRNTFMESTTREGAIASLNKIAELSYERDDKGNLVLENGEPVIGGDFYGFFENVEAISLENRAADVDARLRANRYDSQESRDKDERLKAALDILREDSEPAQEVLPESLRLKAEEIERREKELNNRQQTEKVQERKTFELGLQQDAQKRISDSIARIVANVEKQGAVVSPYLKNILPKAIASKLVAKIQGNPTLQGQMQELQRLPVGDESRQRRLAAVDRAIQQYLPDVARSELREAGVQIKAAADAKRAKVEGQVDVTRKTEPKGSTGAVTMQSGKMTADQAYQQSRTEWKSQNPGRTFDRFAEEKVLNRVLQLMSQ